MGRITGNQGSMDDLCDGHFRLVSPFPDVALSKIQLQEPARTHTLVSKRKKCACRILPILGLNDSIQWYFEPVGQGARTASDTSYE